MIKFNSKSKFYPPDLSDAYVHDVEERAYVSRKICKIRWKPEGLDDYAYYFVSGSYDDPRKNGLDLWSYSQRFEQELQPNAEFSPEPIDDLRTSGNVTEVRFLDDKEHFAYCTSDGNVGIVKVEVKGINGRLVVKSNRGPDEWFGSGAVSCSSLDTYESTLAVGSCDGRIFLTATDASKPAATIDGSVPVHSTKFVSKDELVVGSLLGSVSLWDLRVDSATPSHSFPLSRTQRVGVTCLTVFPTERHMLVCGGRNGLISVFDARNLPVPVQVFSTTDEALSELRFHPNRHSVLFSVSCNGSIWQWSNFFQLFDPLRKHDGVGLDGAVDQSLLLEYKTVQPDVKCLLSNNKFLTNCIDLDRDRLICGTDNECIIAIKSLLLK